MGKNHNLGLNYSTITIEEGDTLSIAPGYAYTFLSGDSGPFYVPNASPDDFVYYEDAPGLEYYYRSHELLKPKPPLKKYSKYTNTLPKGDLDVHYNSNLSLKIATRLDPKKEGTEDSMFGPITSPINWY